MFSGFSRLFLEIIKSEKKFCELEKFFHMDTFGAKSFLTVSKRSTAVLKIYLLFFQKMEFLAYHVVVKASSCTCT